MNRCLIMDRVVSFLRFPPCRLRSVGVQQSDLMNLVQMVIVPLKNGLCSFSKVLEMLISVKADMVLPGCQTFDDIRQEIERMKNYLDESEQLARSELLGLDKQTENLTAEQSSLENQKRNRECELTNLKTQLESYRSSLETYNAALWTERRNLQSAEQTLNDMKHKRDEAQKIRDAGIGIFFIPFFGWIAGAVMVGVGQTDLNSASEQVDRAKREVENCECQVRNYSDRVSEYEGLAYTAQSDIQDADGRIGEVVAKLQALSAKREAVADFQGKIRNAVNHLGKLSGVGSVAEMQTRYLIQLDAMMKVMEEMMAALEQMTGDELLYREGIISIMTDLRNNQKKIEEHFKLHVALDNNDPDYY